MSLEMCRAKQKFANKNLQEPQEDKDKKEQFMRKKTWNSWLFGCDRGSAGRDQAQMPEQLPGLVARCPRLFSHAKRAPMGFLMGVGGTCYPDVARAGAQAPGHNMFYL